MLTCKEGVKWVFKLEQEYIFHSNRDLLQDVRFTDNKNKVRLIIRRNGEIIIPLGYAWDGCTPKFCFFDILIGTPDGVVYSGTVKPKTYYASLVHDALYQFLPEMPEEIPLTRRDADLFFFELMENSLFAPRWIYWLTVRTFGGILMYVRKKITRKTQGMVHYDNAPII